MKRLVFGGGLVLAFVLGLPAAQLAQAPSEPAKSPAVFSIVGATIHTVSGADIPTGTLVVRDGKIASVAAGSAPAPGAPVVDGTGKHVYPSLFPPMTVLGLEEIEAVRSTLDSEELGGITPAARADVAMNFDSELLPVARSGGVLLAGVTPRGGIISGTAVAMKIDGWTREDATLKAPAAITVFWPDLRIDRSPSASRSIKRQEKARDEALERLRRLSATRGPTRRRERPRARRACRGTTPIRSSRRSCRPSSARSRSSSTRRGSRRSATP